MAVQTKAKLLRKYKNLSRVLTMNNDLTIQFSGKSAYHLPGLINLPMGDFSDDDFVTMSLGFCDHELGHENYTDSNWYRIAHERSSYLQQMLNALDDVHQEKRLMADFRGTKTTLRKLVELCKVKGFFGPVPDDAPVSLLVHAWVLMKGRCYLDQPLTEYFNLVDSLVLVKFGEQFYKDLHSLLDISILDSLTSTEQCFKAAESIYELLIEWVKDQEPEDDSSDSDDADGADDSSGDSSDSDDADGTDDSSGDSSDSDDADGTDDSSGDSSDSDDADGADDSSGDSSDSDDADGTDDSSGDSSYSDDADGTDDSSGDSSDSDDADGTDDSSGDSSDSDDADGTDDSSGDLSDSDDACHAKSSKQNPNGTQDVALTEKVLAMLQELEDFDDDFHEKLTAAIDAMAEINPGNASIQALPFNRNSIHCPIEYRRLINDDCHRLIIRIKNPLKRVFHDQNYVNHSYKNRGKTISSSRLASVSIGNTKVFEAETIHRSPNAAIALLVDKSGSMNDEDMRMANSVAYSLSTALDGIHGVESMVGYYPSVSADGYGLAVVKPFGDKKALNVFNVSSEGGTPTAEAITTAVSSLVTRPEPRKLLFVITDGDPNCPVSTEQAIEEAQAVGVKVFGIGIKRSVSGFSEADFQVIQSTDELVNALTKGLKHAF
ncbi:VWA domain-containing protein [Shewanella morhuae]|uniref:Nitric oxide reductase activation protein n=1 Tax=Shewanella morhuae TaxID=365591 RepID=A0A380BXF1_9GAMM|nr:VWA domain-containing protein [Shewanella morhuae]SUJ07824.1 Nitric oxide reductase activation protein [Shewanella morhuae]